MSIEPPRTGVRKIRVRAYLRDAGAAGEGGGLAGLDGDGGGEEAMADMVIGDVNARAWERPRAGIKQYTLS